MFVPSAALLSRGTPVFVDLNHVMVPKNRRKLETSQKQREVAKRGRQHEKRLSRLDGAPDARAPQPAWKKNCQESQQEPTSRSDDGRPAWPSRAQGRKPTRTGVQHEQQADHNPSQRPHIGTCRAYCANADCARSDSRM